MKYKSHISHHSAGWKKPPETTLYVTVEDCSDRFAALAECLAPAILEKLPGKQLENMSGITSIPTFPIFDVVAESRRFRIASSFVEMNRNTIRYDITQTKEDCESWEEVTAAPLEALTAGLSWYTPRGIALFGTRTPQLSEFWEVISSGDNLDLRISGPYEPDSGKLPLLAEWAEVLEDVFSKTVNISLQSVMKESSGP